MAFIRKTEAETNAVHWRVDGKKRQKNFKTRSEEKILCIA